MERMRLDKFLANAGLGSRSDVKNYIKSSRIKVNDKIEKDSGKIINVEVDKISFDNKDIEYKKNIYIMLNKPCGVVSATNDNLHKTVLDLLDEKYQKYKIFPVGRLDIDTQGLLILTNDGELSHNLLSPKKHIPKTYYVEVDKKISEKDILKFEEGIILDDGYKTMPADLNILEIYENKSKVTVTIKEGKFHQIKRMFADLNAKVTYLERIKMGELELDKTLKYGEYRELSDEELRLLKNIN